MVVDLYRGRPDEPTRGAEPDAKIDIVVRNGKLLIESGLRKKNIAAEGETSLAVSVKYWQFDSFLGNRHACVVHLCRCEHCCSVCIVSRSHGDRAR